MPPPSYKDKVEGLALDLAWSLWAELGVSGWSRRHEGIAIDLEPLIIATAYLGTYDARLQTESLDWCVLNARFISAVRLRNLLPTFGHPTALAFNSFGATIRSHSPRTLNWPTVLTSDILRFEPTGRSSVPDLDRSALVQLKLRAVFGISARAEIVLRMLPEPARPFGISELSMYTAYRKDNISDALDLLALAKVVERNVMTTAGSTQVFRLRAEKGLQALLVELPGAEGYPNWAARFRVMLKILQFAVSASEDRAARAADIVGLIDDLQSDLRWVGSYPRMGRGLDAVNEGFERWSTGLLSAWARTETIEDSQH
jgi:hypothetical protein